MLHTKAFVKKTKAGKILRVVREHYLRDDIQCAAPLASLVRQRRRGSWSRSRCGRRDALRQANGTCTLHCQR